MPKSPSLALLLLVLCAYAINMGLMQRRPLQLDDLQAQIAGFGYDTEGATVLSSDTSWSLAGQRSTLIFELAQPGPRRIRVEAVRNVAFADWQIRDFDATIGRDD